jgi:cytochrome c-type biogenesis protein CcmH
MSTNLLAFYAACTALLLFVLGALVVPLLRRGHSRRPAPDAEVALGAIYRDQLRELEGEVVAGTLTSEQEASARHEVVSRLAEDLQRAPAAAMAQPRRARSGWRSPMGAAAAGTVVAIVAGAWWLYAWLGAPTAIQSEVQRASQPVAAAAPVAGERAAIPGMEVLAQRLALKLRTQTPDDGEGWALLARSYVELKQYREAADAFSKAVKHIPNDATLLADYADALGMANGKTLRGEPAALVQRALKADPKHPKALALAASAAFEDKKYRQAIGYWEELRALLAPTSDEARGIEANIAEANTLLGAKSLAAPTSVAAALAAAVDAAPTNAAGGAISGTVRVAPELAAKVSSGDTLLVYAKAVARSGPPLAVVRVSATGLPFSFRLDDSQAMVPELRLSSVSEVALTARVSHNGTATPQSGDLQGVIQPVKVGAQGVELVMDQVVR